MNPLKAAYHYAKARASWLGAGGLPVSQSLANQRASVCLTCPKNQPHPIYENLAAPVAQELRNQIELKAKMKLVAEGEENLHVCEGCWCVMKLKVWSPLRHILPETPLSDLNQSDPICWIISENENLDTVKE